jgi:MFS family permease
VTEPLSPYAPGIISEPPAPPRPAGRPVVFLVATFVVVLVTSGTLFFDWALRADVGRGTAQAIGVLSIAASAPRFLALLWAYLSDRVPLWGTRREGYLLFAALIMALTWLALAIASNHRAAWIAGAVLLAGTSIVARAAIGGGLAEIGQRAAATGRLAAAFIAVAQLATIATPLLSVPFPFASLWLTAGVVAGLSLALVLLIVTLSDDGVAAPVETPPVRPSIPRFLRSRVFWSAFAVCALSGMATVPRELYTNSDAGNNASPFDWALKGMLSISVIAVSIAYFFCCRRIRFGALLRGALVIKAVALIAHPLAAGLPGEWPGQLAFVARGAANGLLSIALADLGLRVAPPGREAFGYMALAAVTSVVIFMAGVIESSLGVRMERIAWFAAAAAIAAGLAAWLLPAEITNRADGRVIGSPS